MEEFPEHRAEDPVELNRLYRIEGCYGEPEVNTQVTPPVLFSRNHYFD
jgi:hypothetical protein